MIERDPARRVYVNSARDVSRDHIVAKQIEM